LEQPLANSKNIANESKPLSFAASGYCGVRKTESLSQAGQIFNRVFYRIKPFVSRVLQLYIRRLVAWRRFSESSHLWPIDSNSGVPPPGWQGWPEGKQFALVLSHDVDTAKGCRNVLKLADLEERLGFRSCFNFVPERYGKISLKLIEKLKQRGFGVSVHGLKHDGKLFSSRKIFNEQAKRINAYLSEWGTAGFTTPSMICNHEWMHELSINYATSTFDTDPFEPVPVGVRTIFPYWVSGSYHQSGFLELPYTLAQDFTLFVILRQKDIEIWKEKLAWIVSNGGMALLNTHPDYMSFSDQNCGWEEYHVKLYRKFLKHVKTVYKGRCWLALPSQVYEFYTSCSACHGSASQILGDADRVSHAN
jgi:hypothetical protein